MDDLQLGLIGAGAAVVLGVIIYNALQYAKIRRAERRIQASNQPDQPDSDIGQTEASPPDWAGYITPPFPDDASIEKVNPLDSLATGPSSTLDARIDCIVPLHLDAPVAAEKVMPLMHRLRHAGSKPIFIEGQAEEGGWQRVHAGGRYRALRVAVPYANRSGPLNEVEFSEWIVGAQALAEALDAGIECPDMVETVARARELDAFAARCDQQLAIYLISEDAPWAARTVQSVVSQDGLTLTRDGLCFIKRDDRKQPIFTLQLNDIHFLRDDLNEKSSRTIQLLLDVPRVGPAIQPFRKMVEYAQDLSQRLGAQIVDERQRPLSEPALHEIETQLLVLYRTLNEAGMPAGSPAAHKLFS